MASAALARAGQWGVEGWLGWWDVSEKGKNIVPKMDFKCAHVGEHRGAIKGDRKEREREREEKLRARAKKVRGY